MLSESYLYTTEAMSEFLDHLTPNGILSIIVADLAGGGFQRHSVRQLSLFIEALHRRGIDDPARHVAVIASPEGVPQVAMLVKNSPFTPDESNRLGDFAARMGFFAWALPGTTSDTVQARYLATPRDQLAAFRAQYPLDLDGDDGRQPLLLQLLPLAHPFNAPGQGTE